MKKILFLIFVACIFFSCDEAKQAYKEVTAPEPKQEWGKLEYTKTSDYILYCFQPGLKIYNYQKIFLLINKDFNQITATENQINKILSVPSVLLEKISNNTYIVLIKDKNKYKYIDLKDKRIGNLEDSIFKGPIYILIPL